MRNKLICGIFSSLFAIGAATTAVAQPLRDYIEPKGWSLGIMMGGSDLWGDVGTKSPIDHYSNMNYGDYVHGMGGLFVRYTFQPSFVLRMGVNYGMVGAGDNMNVDLAKKAKNFSDEAVQRYVRNQDVRTRIWEADINFEIQPLRFNPGSRAALRRWQPYLLTGINIFNYKPQGKYKNKNGGGAASGQWIDLYDLHLEGDGFDEPGAPAKYSLWNIAIPLGIGSKWDLSSSIGLGIEYVYRYTFTDYLDGVSKDYINPALYDKYLTPQKAEVAKAMADKSWELDPTYVHQAGEHRGNHKGSDGYSTISITLFYKFKSRAVPWWE
jgi:hypothetical protein